MPYYNQFFIPLFLKYIPFQSSFKNKLFFEKNAKETKNRIRGDKKRIEKEI